MLNPNPAASLPERLKSRPVEGGWGVLGLIQATKLTVLVFRFKGGAVRLAPAEETAVPAASSLDKNPGNAGGIGPVLPVVPRLP